MSAADIIRNRNEVRARLWQPANARPDHGIDLQRGRGNTPALLPPRRLRLIQNMQATRPMLVPPQRTELWQSVCRDIGGTPPPFLAAAIYEQLVDPPAIVARTTFQEIDRIKRIVCKRYGVTRADIIGHQKTQRVFIPRMIAIYLVRTTLNISYPKIARRFGRDHATIQYSVVKATKLRESDPEFNAAVESIMEELKGDG